MAGKTLGEMFNPPLDPSDTVAVRVVAVAELPRGGIKNVTVTVNAPADMSIADIARDAADFYNEGGLASRGQGEYGGYVLYADIASVSEGGFSDPALTLE